MYTIWGWRESFLVTWNFRLQSRVVGFPCPPVPRLLCSNRSNKFSLFSYIILYHQGPVVCVQSILYFLAINFKSFSELKKIRFWNMQYILHGAVWHWNYYVSVSLEYKLLWRNRLARSTVNRKVAGSSPARSDSFDILLLWL